MVQVVFSDHAVDEVDPLQLSFSSPTITNFLQNESLAGGLHWNIGPTSTSVCEASVLYPELFFPPSTQQSFEQLSEIPDEIVIHRQHELENVNDIPIGSSTQNKCKKSTAEVRKRFMSLGVYVTNLNRTRLIVAKVEVGNNHFGRSGNLRCEACRKRKTKVSVRFLVRGVDSSSANSLRSGCLAIFVGSETFKRYASKKGAQKQKHEIIRLWHYQLQTTLSWDQRTVCSFVTPVRTSIKRWATIISLGLFGNSSLDMAASYLRYLYDMRS